MMASSLLECSYKSSSCPGGRWLSVVVRRKMGVLLAIVLLTPFFVLMLLQNPDLSSERVLVERVAELRERLGAAQALNTHRLQDISLLANKFSSVMTVMNSSTNMNMSLLSPPARELLLNYSNPGALQLPNIYSYLPYLLHDAHSTAPAYALSKGRTDVEIVLGVPTVKREVQSYLMTTLHNLVNSMSDQERDISLIVVFVAEPDIDYVHKVASLIERNLAEHVKSGLIDVVSPPSSFYPDFNSLRRTLGDPLERVKWRTKQNLDYAFLMMYAQPKGLLYLQLEDDVQTKPGYISTMRSFALQKTAQNRDWFVLDFCQLGAIGKMYKCAQLPYLVQFFLMFYNDKPVDWLLDYLVQTKSCNLDKDRKHCQKEKEKVWIRYKPSLFQHIGTHSSLRGKLQKLKDKQFGKVQLFFPHSNPDATVESTIKHYKLFTLDKAYKGESYFWGLLPQQGDQLTFTFDQPSLVQEYLFRSGNVEHPSDRFYNTTVEVLPVKPHPPLAATAVAARFTNSAIPGYLIVGSFDDLGVAQGTIPSSIGLINKLKLHVHTESDNWSILSEIHIKTGSAR
uniref:Alpha-1,3-mannosyl-glycoprotein 4-beta-N-acetylglucosaminyltransferase B n=1 Tax=Hirondellea gigas TaxID=1518452 RepID=A0A2P2HXG7_9CRUS